MFLRALLPSAKYKDIICGSCVINTLSIEVTIMIVEHKYANIKEYLSKKYKNNDELRIKDERKRYILQDALLLTLTRQIIKGVLN